jgi:hypothetical protein
MKEMRASKALPQLGCGPVAMVRMQKAQIKYKKPFVFLRARKCFQWRFIDCDAAYGWHGQGGGETLEA